MKHIDVPGRPRPQGSLRTFVRHGGSTPVTLADDPRVYDFRRDIQSEWRRAYPDPMDLFVGDVLMHLTFWFRRPDSHYLPANRKRSAPELRATAPMYYRTKPDLDKLIRAVGDALTGWAFLDDDQVVQVHAAKVWGDTDHTIIEVMDMGEHDAEQ